MSMHAKCASITVVVILNKSLQCEDEKFSCIVWVLYCFNNGGVLLEYYSKFQGSNTGNN